MNNNIWKKLQKIDNREIDYNCRIAEAMNTYNHALSLIIEKGYKIFIYPSPNESDIDDLSDFWAIKDGRDFISTNPLSLLGLIEIWERYGDHWREQEVEDNYNKLLERTFPKNNYNDYDEATFIKLKEDFRLFFQRIGFNLSDDITREELGEIISNFAMKIEQDAQKD